MKNQVDENGRLHGYWEVYYDDGILNFRGNYKSGIKHGNFKNGKTHGLWEECHFDGKLMRKGFYRRDNPAGLWYDIVEK